MHDATDPSVGKAHGGERVRRPARMYDCAREFRAGSKGAAEISSTSVRAAATAALGTGAATRDWGRTRGWNCKRDRGRHRREGRIMRCGPHSGKRPRQVSLQRQTGQCKTDVGRPRESGSARTGICSRSETRPPHLSHPTRHILRRQSAPEDFCFRARPPRPRRKTSTTTERT